MKRILYLSLFICSILQAGKPRLFAYKSPAAENVETNQGLDVKREQTAQCAKAMASLLTSIKERTDKNPQDLTDEDDALVKEDLARIARNVETCRQWGVIPASEIERALRDQIIKLNKRPYVRPPLTSLDNPVWLGAASTSGGVVLGVAILALVKGL